jgi:hypothetical protein
MPDPCFERSHTMKKDNQNKPQLTVLKTETPSKSQTKKAGESSPASGRWSAVHRARLPHKAGLPLSSGGCGDQIER